MTCFYCKGDMTESTTTHFAELKNCIVIIKMYPVISVLSAVKPHIPPMLPSDWSKLFQRSKKSHRNSCGKLLCGISYRCTS